MTSIELHHIDRNCHAATKRTFPVHWFSPTKHSDIIASHSIEGDEADALLELLKRALKGPVDYTLCGHFPDYGLRVLVDGAVKFETTICLTCGNWIRLLDGQAERFLVDHDTFPELSSTLQSFVPLSS